MLCAFCSSVAWAWCHHTPCAFCSGVAWAWRHLLSYIILWKWKCPVDPLTRLTHWPVDPSPRWRFRKRTPQYQLPGPPTYVVDMHHSKRRRIRLCCLPSKRRRCSCVVWGWSLYNIVESESDPLTLDPLTFSKKNPSRAIPRSTYIHPPSLAKIRQRTSEEIGNTHTNAARIIVWWWWFINLI